MYAEAIPLVVASRAIAGHRPVNIELPRYAAGLLKFCTGKGSILEHATTDRWTVTDEEIVAFAVGDMHGMYRGRLFPDIWDRSTTRPRRQTSESESDESMVSESTASTLWNGDMKVESDEEEEETVTWDDVLELVKSRAAHPVAEFNQDTTPNAMDIDGGPAFSRNQVPNRMSIQNLI
jgi:hypothetical protein